MPGVRAFGTTLAYSTTLGGTYTSIANITNLQPWSQKVDTMDTTSHDSTGAYREKVPTILDAGGLSADINYDDQAASHVAMIGQLGTIYYFKITFPNRHTTSTIATFQAIVTGFTPKIPFDNKMTATLTAEITGPITYTAGT